MTPTTAVHLTSMNLSSLYAASNAHHMPRRACANHCCSILAKRCTLQCRGRAHVCLWIYACAYYRYTLHHVLDCLRPAPTHTLLLHIHYYPHIHCSTCSTVSVPRRPNDSTARSLYLACIESYLPAESLMDLVGEESDEAVEKSLRDISEDKVVLEGVTEGNKGEVVIVKAT